MEKVIRDGKVAVLYSPGYGSGWSTWAPDEYREALCMDARLVRCVLDGNWDEAAAIAEELCPEVYTGSITSLVVEWVEKGSVIRIVERNGYEDVEYVGDPTLIKV